MPYYSSSGGRRPPSRCPVCHEQLFDSSVAQRIFQTPSTLADPWNIWIAHLQKVHPDYYKWRQERFDHPQYPWLTIPGGLACVGLIFYLLILQSILIVLPILLILALWAVSPLSFRLGTRRFREKWVEEHQIVST